MWTIFAVMLIGAPISGSVAAPTVAILREEPLDQTRRAQDDKLLDAPEADVSRFLSSGESAQFHAYRRPRWMRGIADLAIEGALFWLLVFGGLGEQIHASSVRVQQRLAESLARKPKLGAALRDLDHALDKAWGARDWPAALRFALAIAALGCLALWPTSLIFDWWIPRAHGLSDQSIFRWLALALLELCKQSLGLAALAFGLWALMRRVKRLWLWLGVPAGILVALAGLADPLSVQLRNQLTPLENGAVRTSIEAVLQRAGVEAEEIDRIDAHRDTLMLDAFVIGQGKTRRIVLFDTLIAALTPAQLSAVVAHELGHVKDGSRVLRAALAGLAVPILLFLALRFLGFAARSRRFEFREASDVRALPLLLGAAWFCTLLVSPIANHFSRERELRADLFALDLTRDPESLRAALLTLARKNQLDPAPPAAIAALFYDHPTLGKRLGLIDAWDTQARAGSR